MKDQKDKAKKPIFPAHPSDPVDRQPVYMHCVSCFHEWVAFFTGLTVDMVRQLSPGICQRCGSFEVYMGKLPEDLKEMEHDDNRT